MQLCVLLAIVSSLVATDVASDQQVIFLWHKLAAVFLLQVLVVTAAWGIAARTVADVQCLHLPAQQIRHRLDFGTRIHLYVWGCVSALVLSVLQWPQIVSASLGNSILLDELAAIAPIIVPLVLSWGLLYDADRVITVQAIQLSRVEYVASHVRSFLLLPLLPVLALLGFSDFIEVALPQLAAHRYSGLVRTAPLLLVFFGFPILIRLLWRAAPMPPGPLRSRLQARARDLGFQVRDILVWHTYHRTRNAAVCGVVRRWRYVLLTDRLVDDLSPPQVEMVFLHEIGHAQLGHCWKLMAVTTATVGTGVLLTTSMLGSAENGHDSLGTVNALVMTASISLSLFLVGRYARLLELEADLWAASRINSDVDTYLRAMATVASGSDPDRPSWLHPSFAHRCEFLLQGTEPASAWLQCRLRIATVLLLGTVAFILAYAAIC